RGARAGDSARGRGRSHLQIAQRNAPEHDHVAVTQVDLFDAASVDERAIGAAVIEDARAGGPIDEQGVAAGDRVLVQPQVRRQSAADARDLALEPYQAGLARSLNLQVAAG